ncbi:MAG TPA: hypothetical protein VM785_06800, partial [Gaiellales bacterium]|nr:hypothetical protein [Gaiellales bacterium]
MTRVAVVAHAGKSIEGGLPQLRRTLAEHGVDDPLWAEVDKSRRAPKQIKRLLQEGADLFFVWGGDGMAQRSVDVLAGTDAAMAIVRPVAVLPFDQGPDDVGEARPQGAL